MPGCIIGWAHTPFGKHEDRDLEDLIVEAAAAAIDDAGIAPSDLDAIYVGNFGGFEKQSFPASFALNADPSLRFKPATRIENACATGSAAIHLGLNDVAAGRSRFVLVVGAERMTVAPGATIGDILLNASYRKEEGETEGGFAGIFGQIADRYFQVHGNRSEALARIAGGQTPFYRLPALGGQNMLRGYYEGRYRDELYLASQVEYRTRLWRRIGAVAFAALGDVGPNLRDFGSGSLTEITATRPSRKSSPDSWRPSLSRFSLRA